MQSRLIKLAMVAAMMTAGSGSARALTFNFTTIPGDTLTAAQSNAFITAGNAWSSVLADPVAVSVNIGFTNLGTGVLGETSPNYITITAAQATALLVADAKTSSDTAAVASLVALPLTGSIAVTRAQAGALGMSTPGLAGTIEFSTNYTFATSRSAMGTIPGNAFDLIGVAEHEIAHLLGFDSSIDFGTPNGTPTLLDAFRFTGVGARTSKAGNAFFSLDDGVSAVLDPLNTPANFAPGGPSQYQASHWAPGVDGIMIPAYSPGQVIDPTALDVKALDILGYDAATAVPEPDAAAILLAGLLSVGLLRRRDTRD